MKKIISTFFIASCIYSTASAQLNIASLHNQNCDLENSFLNPSFIGNEYKDVKVSLFPVYVNIGNNFTSAADVYDYYKDFQKQSSTNTFNTSAINNIMSNLKAKNILYAGADVTLLNVGVNIHRKRKQFLELQFSARQHVHANAEFNKELMYLLYKGNKYYENQTIDILPKINALQYGDYGINIAKTFTFFKEDAARTIRIKPAIRLRYLVGNANVNTQNSSLNIYTAPDGRYIDATLNGRIQQSNIDGNSFNNIDSKSITNLVTKGAGTGMAVDLGATMKFGKRISASAALVDNGSINFKKNAYIISANSTYRWEGYNLNSNVDSFLNQKNMLNLDSTKSQYTVNIGSKLVLSGSYGFGKKMKFKRYLDYYHHTLSVFYVQGFHNYLNATTNPYLSVGYSYRYRNVVNAGVNASVGGLTGTSLGAHIQLGLGPIQLGFATNSLAAVFDKYSSKGFDLHFFTALSF